MKAYGIQLHQLKGPSWVGSEYFDIVARSPAGASKNDIPAMLQDLLAKRFHASVHWEEAASDGYVLRLDGELRLKPCELSECPRQLLLTSPGSGVIVILANTLGGLAQWLSDILRQPVVDATGTEGSFAIVLPLQSPNQLAPSTPGPGDQLRLGNQVIDIPGSAPSAQDAVKGLGLRLVREKTALKTRHVDQLDRAPTEN